MLLTKLLNNTILSGTYCRQYMTRCFTKRCFCAPSTSEVIDTRKRKKRNVVTLDKNENDVVLDFFNNCDHVTLNKLIGYKSHLFKHYDYSKCITSSREDRFCDVEDFLNKTGITEDKLKEMAYAVLLFKNVENTSTGMKFFYPKFDRKNIENIDKVVVLDVFHREFAWCVRNTDDGYITDIGLKKINLKGTYDHLAHHNQIRRFLETIPESEVYLLRTSTARGRTVSKQGSRYAVHQAVVEALLITLLNERHQPTDLEYVHPSDENGTERRKFENRVYLFEPPALRDFYNVTFQKDLLEVSDLFKDWYFHKHSNIKEWGLDNEERKQLFFDQGAGQVSICALITDVFCRSLKKKNKQFPHAYT
ncbi:uncharacterized protein LOC123564436 [Mercenaria mercenaria]|uniref:uncharacterized protein LOC123564436 n=1 Tax=Mercenaria mercenaria TaxID=6596 RepID=UPI00234F7DC8|nr:uncharacterized protein LOC123564436 [Mercenaria mercenaria]